MRTLQTMLTAPTDCAAHAGHTGHAANVTGCNGDGRRPEAAAAAAAASQEEGQEEEGCAVRDGQGGRSWGRWRWEGGGFNGNVIYIHGKGGERPSAGGGGDHGEEENAELRCHKP